MVCISLQSLSNLCAIRIAYLVWARRYVTKNCSKQKLFDKLVDVVLSDVRSLPFPEQTIADILKQLEPTGKHLLSLLSLWFFAEPKSSQKCLTGDMLYECITLNSDGLINQRKTAQKILSSRMLDNVFAFRFACINFLEKEVLKLWIFVKEYFLNKLILEGDEANCLIERTWQKSSIDLNEEYYCFNMREYTYSKGDSRSPSSWSNRDQFPFTTEREEVLFWIGYCLSKEDGISIKEIPHFLGYDFDWYTFSLDFAAFSGNVACFDYFRNFHDTRIEYNYANILRKMFYSHQGEEEEQIDYPCFDRQLPCFIFHYVLLNREEKADLFCKFPYGMLFYFLQWPLSLTFLDNLERIWKLLDYNSVFYEMFELFGENTLRLPTTNRLFNLPSCSKINGFYSPEHLVRIWVALWNLASHSIKSRFLDEEVFLYIQISEAEDEFFWNFETSRFKEKLFELFLSNGEAILELYEKDYVKESLRNLAAKYMPEDFADLDHQCISLISNGAVFKCRNWEEIPKGYNIEKNNAGPLHGIFLNYLKNYFFLQNRNENSI